jgi:hypothetical protein
MRCNAAQREEVFNTVEQAVERRGGLDVLANTAGNGGRQ